MRATTPPSQIIVGSGRTLAGSDQPVADSCQPFADSDQPFADSDQPVADSCQPFVGSDQPVADSCHPLVGSAPTLVSNRILLALPQLLQSPDAAILWTFAPLSSLDETLRHRLETLLDETTLARLQRFRFEKHQALFLQAHALLRLLLGCATGMAPRDVVLVQRPQGRPELASGAVGAGGAGGAVGAGGAGAAGAAVGASGSGAAPLRFNLSHTAGQVAVVLTQRADCGVDVEEHGRSNDLGAIAQRHFAATERAALATLSGDEWMERFYMLWTLKEAYIKAGGQGLSLPLQRFAFSMPSTGHWTEAAARPETADQSRRTPLPPDGTITLHDDAYPNDAPERWQCLLRAPTPGHTLACVLDRSMNGGRPFTLHEFHAAQLWEYF